VDVSETKNALETPRSRVGRSPRAWRSLRCDAIRCHQPNQRPRIHQSRWPCAAAPCFLVRGGGPRNRSVNVMARQVGNCACAVRGISVETSDFCPVNTVSIPGVHSAPREANTVIVTIDWGRAAGGGQATVDLVHEPATARAGS
jgi:hypothetical protein